MSGRRSFRDLAERVTATAEGRARVEEYRRLLDSIVTLYRLREQRGFTQTALAEALDVTQGNVSRVENAADLYVSTLARYVKALGGELEINAVFQDQVVALELASGSLLERTPEPESLAGYVDGLEARLREGADRHQRELPRWTRVVLSEEVNGHRTGGWMDVSEFEARFREILRLTARQWVNLHAESVEEGALRLVVEYVVDSRRRNKRPRASSHVAVNLSGPEEPWWLSLPRRVAS